jgi:prevent-host-death family protein
MIQTMCRLRELGLFMRTLPLAEAKTHFSAVIEEVTAGNEVGVSYGKKRETVAVIVPFEQWKRLTKRQLGTLKERGSVIFAHDFSMTEEELIGL